MFFFFFLMIRRPPRSTQSRSSAASDVYKRQVRDDDDAVWDRDAGQSIAGKESSVPDAGGTAGDRVASGFAPRTLDERRLALVKQDPIQTAIDGVARIHRDPSQAGAACERVAPDAGDAGGDRDCGQ